MAGRPSYCGACRGWGALFKREVTYYGSGHIQAATPHARLACEKCGGMGYPNTEGPARTGTAPVLLKHKRRKAGVQRRGKRAAAPGVGAPVVEGASDINDLAGPTPNGAPGEGGLAGSV